MSNLWVMERGLQSNRNSKRNRCPQDKTYYAQSYTDERHKNKPKHIKLTKAVEKFVDEKLQGG